MAEEKKQLLSRFVDVVEDKAGDAWEMIVEAIHDSDLPWNRDQEDENAFTNFVRFVFRELLEAATDEESDPPVLESISADSAESAKSEKDEKK